MKPIQRGLGLSITFAFLVAASPQLASMVPAFSLESSAQAAPDREFRFKANVKKKYEKIEEEDPIRRRRVLINRRVTTKSTPAFLKSEDIEFERARRVKLDEKTNQLIRQLETLSKRRGQQSRVGEIKMRLAELYFEQGQAMAAHEGEAWEAQVKQWEALSDSEQARRPRPTLRTPRADAYRKNAIRVYSELERMSRAPDAGRSKMVRRDEVLYFYGKTLMDLGERKKAAPLFREVVERFPRSPRIFSARLNLADIEFDSGHFEKAIPLYLKVATGEGAPKEDAEPIKAYALYKLGWAYMNNGEHPKAIKSFRRTLEVSQSGKYERKIVFEKETANDLAHAYALAGQFKEGEAFLQSLGSTGQDALKTFRSEAAGVARDKGDFNTAIRAYDKLIAENPSAPEARQYAYEKVQIALKRGNVAAYQQALDRYATEYGAGSAWYGKQDADEQKAAVEEIAGLLRREAKNNHRIAQVKDKPVLFNQTRGYYAIYFKHVPQPNADDPKSVHEMRFYYGELLYKLGDYRAAATAYGQAGEGKYGSVSAYNRILALKEASKNDKNASRELIDATQAFVDKYPGDQRVGDLLYTSAKEAFSSGDTQESVEALRKVIAKFPNNKTGVEAARRILFIYEKNNDLDQAVKEADGFLANSRLVKAGGADFVKDLREYKQKAGFKRAEQMTDAGDKAKAFYELSGQSQGDLREKALNNAIVFANQAGDTALAAQARARLLKEFPNSVFAKDVYFQNAEAAAKEGRWSEALKNYKSYIARYSGKGKAGKEADDIEAARWNRIYIQAHLENVWEPELYPSRGMSGELLGAAMDYLSDYPRSKNREALMSLLAFRRGVDEGDIQKLRRSPGLHPSERSILDEASIVLEARSGRDPRRLVGRYSPASANTMLKKAALAQAAFQVVDAKFRSYQGMRIDYKPQRFVSSLKKKISALEKLERDYLNVVAYGDGNIALKSLERLSSLYRTLAADIQRAPAPKEELKPFSDPLFEKGVGFIKTCFDKAAELKIAGPGLSACRSVAAEVRPELSPLTLEIVPDPKWLPAIPSDQSVKPLFKKAYDAFAKGRMGEFSLAMELLNRNADTMSPFERAALENMTGLWDWRLERNEEAVKHFRLATEGSSSVQSAAYKNLAAVYLAVGDYAQAVDALEAVELGGDGDLALLKGLSYRGQGDFQQALTNYEVGLESSPNNQALLFNRALALGLVNSYSEAAKSMGRYIELSTPSSGHISRRLLRAWKERSRENKLPDDAEL